MKVLLINPDYLKYCDPPLGLASIAAYARENCPFVKIKIFDQISPKKLIPFIKKFNPAIIGLSAASANYYYVKELAIKIKNKFPSALLIIGGIHITNSPESFEKSPFDMAVIGEGEVTFTRLLRSIEKNNGINIKELANIKGLILRLKEKIINTGHPELIKDLDKIPLPARDLLNMDYYLLPSMSSDEGFEPIGSIMTSRGCPYHCRFCASSSFWGGTIRFFSATRVAEEIEILYRKYHYREISIYDDLFTINKSRLKEIISILESKGILGKIKFYVLGRANNFDDETAELLKKLGTHSVTFGLESASQKILTYLKREGVTVEDNKKALAIAKKHGIHGGSFFMIGSPNETLEDIKKTRDFIKENCPNSFIIYQTVPLPGTEIWEYALKRGIVKKDQFEHKQKDFVDMDIKILLSSKISPEEFTKEFYNLRGMYVKRNTNFLIAKLFKLRPRHINKLISPMFLKKAYALRRPFLEKFFKVKKQL